MDKIEAVLLDADGLLLKKQAYFSDIYSRAYGVPVELIIPFFKTTFRDCQRGLLDLKSELPSYLKQWGWEKSVEEFLDYWFSSCTEVDEKVLRAVHDLRIKGIRCYLATDQENYRGEYIKKNLGLENHLDGFFYSYEMGFSKSEKEFFEKILKSLCLSPEKVAFLDDEEENIKVAKSVGMNANFIEQSDGIDSVLKNLFN